MDAITLIKEDHRLIDQLFQAIDHLDPAASQKRAQIATQLIQVLETHAALEETLFYPALRQVSQAPDRVLEAAEAHHAMKLLLAELGHMDPRAENHRARLKVLEAIVREHVAEEECELLPSAEDLLGAERLRELGEQMAAERGRIETQGAGFSVTMIREFPVEQPKRR